MSNPRDEIDGWLEREVTPLMPPSGTLERIRHTARRRKRRQAALAVAGCAVVVAAAAAGPPVLTALQQHPAGHGQPPLATGSTPAAGPSTSAGASSPESAQATRLPTQAPSQHTRLSTGTSGTVPPANFQPSSVTFVGAGARVVGAVIGQAGTPGHCATRDCTSLAGTPDYGKTWYGVSAPITGGLASASGVSQLRFLNLTDGWAFGPGLWETSQGGWPWNHENAFGLHVLNLETAGSRAFAVLAGCTGSPAHYASGCTSFSLYSSAAGSTRWTAVAVPAAFRPMTAPAPSAAALVISAGTTGYLLAPSGQVLRGPVAGGPWTLAGAAPCKPGAAQASGQPTGALLAAGPKTLVLACSAGPSSSKIYLSADGISWHAAGVVATSGPATSIASAAGGQIVLASTGGIRYSLDSGASWQTARIATQVPGGFSYVGMTNAAQGVAIPARPALGEILVTSDGGSTWTSSPITG